MPRRFKTKSQQLADLQRLIESEIWVGNEKMINKIAGRLIRLTKNKPVDDDFASYEFWTAAIVAAIATRHCPECGRLKEYARSSERQNDDDDEQLV